jgi:hypothetical protein
MTMRYCFEGVLGSNGRFDFRSGRPGAIAPEKVLAVLRRSRRVSS